MKIDILLTGSFGVGKSSIFNRVIHDEFTNNYNGTIGVRSGTKEIMISGQLVEITLYDITGEVEQRSVPIAYFHKKNIIVYVIDLSRPFTFDNIREDILYIRKTVPGIDLRIVGNKKDIILKEELIALKTTLADIYMDGIISAKTNENVDAFLEEITAKTMNSLQTNS